MSPEHAAAPGGQPGAGAMSDDDKASVTVTRDKPARIDWAAILALAAPMIHAERDKVGVAPSLRRVHYLLVSSEAARALGYANTENAYKALSRTTTTARDAGTFPQLLDQTRSIEHARGWKSPQQLIGSLVRSYSLDRSQYLETEVVLIAEKAGVVPLLTSRYAWLTVTASRGYASVSHANAIADVVGGVRDAVALYIGDYDPTGLDIDRALAERLPFRLVRIALNADQVRRHNLPPAPAKVSDSRSAAMAAAHGEAMQVELDALPSDALFTLIDQALGEYAGVTVRGDGMPDWPDVDEREQADREWLRDLAESAGGAR